MNPSDFQKNLQAFNKNACVLMVTQALEAGTIDVFTLYEHYLQPSLYNIANNNKAQDIPIWAEHVTSGIVRTLMEIAYPYILKDIRPEEPLPRAIVFCPVEEYHDLGARMTADYLTLLHYDALFIGANTPSKEALDAIAAVEPQLICISVTNYFHLSHIKTLIDTIRQMPLSHDYHIVVGGYAISHTPQAMDTLGADYYANTYEDLKTIKEDIHETRF